MEEFAKNGSGYFDETAYKAIKRVEDGVARGEIWEYSMTDGNLREVLVVSADQRKHSSVVSFIMLCNDLPLGATGVQITLGARTMYANCERVTYGYRNRFENLMYLATESEMLAVDDGMLKALQLKASTAPTEVDDEYTKNHQLAEGNGFRDISEREVNLLIERNKLETERDLYKKLFESLYERMIGK